MERRRKAPKQKEGKSKKKGGEMTGTIKNRKGQQN